MSKHRESVMSRSELTREHLGQYISNTLSHIHTVREFCDRHSKWALQRETELEMMRDIKQRADRIDLKFDHVRNSETKAKAFGEFVWSGLTQGTADSRREELEKELGAVLKDTLGGLEKLDYFLHAVECLAVTCLLVFEENRFLCLPQGTSPASVQAVVTTVRISCPLLIHFKRDAKSFFMPSLLNVEVLALQLDRYIQISQQLCKIMEKGSSSQMLFWKNKNDSLVNLGADVSEESIQKMMDHLNQLNDIRMDQHLRLTFLFQEAAQRFIGRFSQRRPRMEQFLTDLEENAVQLDRMKLGAKISSVAGSSVGVAGGILSIVGLALTPVTAGVSLALTIAGVSLGVTSGVNSLATGITEMKVNSIHEKKAREVFQNFMEDVESLQESLEDVTRNIEPILGQSRVDGVLGAGKVIATAGAIGKGIDSIVDCASALSVKALAKEDLIASAGKLALQEGKAARNLPKLAGDIPDIGQVAKGTPLALSSSARAGFITLNALFIGLDVFFICKDSVCLAKGSKSEFSQLIRARAALWRTELDSWQRIYDSLCRGIWKFRKCQRILAQSFYPPGGEYLYQ
ncbi:apolipoprotein L1-like [Salvelinus namaycush]|uniref:Apolipoprotein L1-like n=1 Tax=Salvelinus namaycush TaxID=8040 RepID=A0A8U0Q2M8_SALNM|nr:apolipoprotein L1-like [Salvelinus namaycush]